MKTRAFSTRLPAELTQALDAVCRKLGLRKDLVVELALREKIEELLDAEDLRNAIDEAATFHRWAKVKKETHRGKKR